MTDEKSIISQYREAVRILDAHRRLLVDARSSPEILETMSAIIKHLHGLSDIGIVNIIGGKRHKENLKDRRRKQAEDAATMTLPEVEKVLDNPKTGRVQLEAIAVGRFQVPSGSLRSLGGIDQLREKIMTLAQNERAHETISSVAKDARY
jgi:hypothetical protein